MSRQLSERALPDFSQLLNSQPELDLQQLDANGGGRDRRSGGGVVAAREQIENAAHHGPLMFDRFAPVPPVVHEAYGPASTTPASSGIGSEDPHEGGVTC